MESSQATILNIVVNQINGTNGQRYFPFIFSLFIFILINNLIGLVEKCLLGILLLFILNDILSLNYSCLHSYMHTKSLDKRGKGGTLPSLLHYSFNNKNSFYLHPNYI